MTKRTITIFIICGFFGLLLIATPIFFYIKDFWNSPRSSNPNDWGTFGDFFGGTINTIVGLLTLVVTIVIAIVLKKIDDRNNEDAISASYKPQLVPEQTLFYTYPTPYFANLLHTEFSPEIKNPGHYAIKPLISPFGIDIYNIGLGSAKSINLKFEFDVSKAVALIDDIATSISSTKRIGLILNYSASGQGYKSLYINYPVLLSPQSGLTFLGERETNLTHMISVSSVSKPYNLLFPQAFLQLYTIYLYTWWEKTQANLKEERDFTPIILSMNYKDIGLKAIANKYKITFIIRGGGTSQFSHEVKVEDITPIPEPQKK